MGRLHALPVEDGSNHRVGYGRLGKIALMWLHEAARRGAAACSHAVLPPSPHTSTGLWLLRHGARA